jgi:hypothetical protein
MKENEIMIRVLTSIILTTKHGRSGAPKTHNL